MIQTGGAKLLPIAVAAILGICGLLLMHRSGAATFGAHREAETGSITAPARTASSATASGGSSVIFGASGGCAPSGQCAPLGDLPGWRQLYVTEFPGTVPLGAFSGCNHNTDTPQAFCSGLQQHGSYGDDWWAYPNGWSDTAKSGADGNTGAPFGGTYHPETVVSVDNGAMHIRMFRPAAGGDNHVAAVVPRKCMAKRYGRYVERFKVVRADPGFKSAHLFYRDGFEMDFPENDYDEQIYAFTHPSGHGFASGAYWHEWHTTAIEWTAGSVKYYMDGRLIGTATRSISDIPMDWVLQNESSILGPYAKPGASAQLDIDWVACYAPM